MKSALLNTREDNDENKGKHENRIITFEDLIIQLSIGTDLEAAYESLETHRETIQTDGTR